MPVQRQQSNHRIGSQGVAKDISGSSALYISIRTVLLIAGIATAYFVLPFTTALSRDVILTLVVGLAAVVGLLLWQIRAIARSPNPRMRAIETMLLTVPLFVIVFATTYYLMSQHLVDHWSEPLSRVDALYFSVTTLATVGFGDITAQSQAARAAVTVQMVGGLLLIGLVVHIVLGTVKEAMERLQASSRHK